MSIILKKRKIICKLTLYEMIQTEEETTLSGQEKFRAETFTVIMNKLYVCILKRLEQYNDLDEKFGFLTYFKSMTGKELLDKAKNLGKMYSDDLGCDIFLEKLCIFPN